MADRSRRRCIRRLRIHAPPSRCFARILRQWGRFFALIAVLTIGLGVGVTAAVVSVADHVLVRTAECIDGSVEIDLVCEPAFDYGRVPGEWTLGPDRHRADATGGGQALLLNKSVQEELKITDDDGNLHEDNINAVAAAEVARAKPSTSTNALPPTTPSRCP